MSNRELILDYLGEVFPGKICDDCLSEELDIYPRQQVNQICRRFVDEGNIGRNQEICSSCHKSKLVNSIVVKPSLSKDTFTKTRVSPRLEVNLYEVRRKILSACQNLWKTKFNQTPSASLPAMVNELKQYEIIPPHQANMMLTLNGLRNSFEHDGLELGEEEVLIANNAWKIVDRWLQEKQQINEG